MSKLPPSQKKLKKAAEEGNFPKSQLVSLVLTTSLLGIFLILAGPTILLRNIKLLKCLGTVPSNVLWSVLSSSLLLAGEALLSMFLIGGIISLVAGLLQSGGILRAFSLFEITQLSPQKGVARIITGIRECWLPIAKGGVAGGILFLGLKWWFQTIQTSLVRNSLSVNMVEVCGVLMLSASGAGAIVAGSEFSFRWFSHRKKLSMSYDEARREAREQEGEPHLKAKRRGLHEELSRGAVLKGIRKAKVVIVEREKGVDRAR